MSDSLSKIEATNPGLLTRNQLSGRKRPVLRRAQLEPDIFDGFLVDVAVISIIFF